MTSTRAQLDSMLAGSAVDANADALIAGLNAAAISRMQFLELERRAQLRARGEDGGAVPPLDQWLMQGYTVI